MSDIKIPAAQVPDKWYLVAHSLRAASNVVWDHCIASTRLFVEQWILDGPQSQHEMNMYGVHLMLLGMAMENLAKAILVRNHPERVENETPWRGHHLGDLFQQAGIEGVTAQEVGILDVLENAIKWAGRYPVPKNHENRTDWFAELSIPEPEEGLRASNVPGLYEEYKKSCDALWRKAAQHYSLQA